MTAISPTQMIAFVDELHKSAGVADWIGQRAKAGLQFFSPSNLSGRYGRQLALGAGAGAAGNVLRHKITDTPEESAQGSLLGQAVHGAMGGAALAGGRILSTKAGREAAGATAKNFLGRERYALTGRGVDHTTEEGLKKARELRIVPARPTVSDFSPPSPTGQLSFEHPAMLSPVDQKRLATRVARTDAAEELFKKDWASAPGALHALTSGNAGEYAKLRWKSMHPLEKAMLGVGVGAGGVGMIRPKDEERGSRFSKGLGTIGSAVGGTLIPGYNFLAGPVASGIGAGVGKGVGSVADMGGRLIHKPGRVVPAEEQAQWQTQG